MEKDKKKEESPSLTEIQTSFPSEQEKDECFLYEYLEEFFPYEPLKERWLTAPEVNRWLGMYEQFFVTHLRNGMFPHAYLTETTHQKEKRSGTKGGVWRIPWSDVMNLLIFQRKITEQELNIIPTEFSLWQEINEKTKWYSNKELAAHLKMHKGTIAKLIKKGNFPRSFLSNVKKIEEEDLQPRSYGVWRVPDCDVLLFLDKQEKESKKVLKVVHRQKRRKKKPVYSKTKKGKKK